MTNDRREGERRISAYRGIVLIILGIGLPIVAAVRGNDFGWQGMLLTGLCLSAGAVFLVLAL
jgi:hypothetical protein